MIKTKVCFNPCCWTPNPLLNPYNLRLTQFPRFTSCQSGCSRASRVGGRGRGRVPAEGVRAADNQPQQRNDDIIRHVSKSRVQVFQSQTCSLVIKAGLRSVLSLPDLEASAV